jgi:hypothetical protein
MRCHHLQDRIIYSRILKEIIPKYSFAHQTGPWAHPGFYPIHTGDVSWGIRRPERDFVTHLHLVSKSEMDRLVPPFPLRTSYP